MASTKAQSLQAHRQSVRVLLHLANLSGRKLVMEAQALRYKLALRPLVCRIFRLNLAHQSVGDFANTIDTLIHLGAQEAAFLLSNFIGPQI